ncbi:MAG: MBL fold metallo-hydrolase [Marinilabiliaceae bacterium]|nr:MBL fold metallo-hydrolase [Marinilabiliaceae bacterium]
MITIEKFVFNPFQENTYLLFDETKECVIVDPGCLENNEQQLLLHFIDSNGLIPKMVLNTHLHLDHVFGCGFVCSQYDISFLAHQNDEFLLSTTKSHAIQFGISIHSNPPSLSGCVNDGDVVKFGNSEVEIIHVPGHSPGCVALYNRAQQFLLSGDILFKGSIGRTDLPMGNYDQLILGIKNKLLTLDQDVIVFPGHGDSTTIGAERKSNPYLA